MSTLLIPGAAKPQLKRPWRLFINGQFEEGAGERTLYDPATGAPLCNVTEAGPEQVGRAVQAARRAFDGGAWSRLCAQERARFLFRLADAIDARKEQLAFVETCNSGKPLREADFDITESANCLRYFAGLITKPLGETVDVPAPSVSQIVREPLGVVAQIVPWNYPLLTAVWKLAPALAAGNTCVLKPSEFTPLSVLLLAEIMQELDLPAGTVNIVNGDGLTVGQPLAESPLVDKISFTGSGRTGRLVTAAAIAGNLKKVTLELGGKSPMVVFDDVDVDLAVDWALYAIFVHAGQVCSAGSRFIVHERIYDRFVEKFVARAGKIKVGPGLDGSTQMGPLVSKQHLQKVLDYIDIGLQEGAKLLCGGDRPSGTIYGDGYYVNPTLFAADKPSMRIVQEEIFGPVAVVEKFSSEEQAVALANATIYGLAAGVWTADVTRAYRVVKAIKAGVVWINGYHSCYNECPFGGYKQSGWGRECGPYGIHPYTEVKQINLNLDPSPVGWFG
jgi:betaine-aldehyde dehydrogenase